MEKALVLYGVILAIVGGGGIVVAFWEGIFKEQKVKGLALLPMATLIWWRALEVLFP